MEFNVYTHYDSNKTVIARIRPYCINIDTAYITERVYNKLLKLRTIGGDAGIYCDFPGYVIVTSNNRRDFIRYMQ